MLKRTVYSRILDNLRVVGNMANIRLALLPMISHDETCLIRYRDARVELLFVSIFLSNVINLHFAH